MKTVSTFSQNFLVWDDKKFHLSPSSSLSFQVFLIIIQGVRCPKGSITLAICIHFPSLSSLYVFLITGYPYHKYLFILIRYAYPKPNIVSRRINPFCVCIWALSFISIHFILLSFYFRHLISE